MKELLIGLKEVEQLYTQLSEDDGLDIPDYAVFYKKTKPLTRYITVARALTLVALGTDEILMGRKGELGPVDPTLRQNPDEATPGMPREIAVEDIYSYINFIKERAGLTDQNALAQQISILSEKLTPPVLGKVQRTYSHIRLVARKLLSL